VVLPIALSFWLFGVSLFTARLVMVAYLLLFVIASYYLLRRIVSRSTALWSVGLLATFSSLYADGKNVLGEVPGLLFLTLFLIFAHRIFDEGKITKINMLCAGLFFGLCLTTKPTFLVLGGAVVVALVYALWYEKRRISVSLMGWGIAGASIPVIVWFLTQFSVHDSPARVFAFYANPYRLEHLSSVMVHNALRFFKESTPLYLLGMFSIWSVALVVRLVKRNVITFVEVVAFCFSLLILAAYLRTPGWYRYFFPVQLIATLFFPAALQYLVGLFLKQRFVSFARISATLLLLLMIGTQTYLLFFNSFIQGYYHSNTTEALEKYFSQYDARTSFFVYDAPQVPLFLPQGAPYYQYIAVNAQGYWSLGAEELSVISKGIPDVVIVSANAASSTQHLLIGYTEKEQVANLIIFQKHF
jgi:4-amino-4-deoxy-L-arabinose transferase-like glycosyltransferase